MQVTRIIPIIMIVLGIIYYLYMHVLSLNVMLVLHK